MPSRVGATDGNNVVSRHRAFSTTKEQKIMRVVLKPAGLFVVLACIGVLLVFALRPKDGIPVAGRAAPPVAMPSSAPATPENLAQNADMTTPGEAGRPANWGNLWGDGGKFEVRRDEAQSHSAPASLLMDTLGTQAKGQTTQIFDVQPGEKYRVGGFIKSAGTGTFTLAVQMYDAKWKSRDFRHVSDTGLSPTWQYHETKIVVPDGVTMLGMALYADGKGKVWLDDMTVTKVP